MSTDRPKVVAAACDGACSGNPGPGGWGALLRFEDGSVQEFGGADAATTNNRMELTAVIQALSTLKRPCAIDVYTDSEYVRQGITTWIRGWKARGWKTADRKPVKNIDLWQALDSLAATHQVQWHWVKGHNGDVGNERADALANRGAAQAGVA